MRLPVNETSLLPRAQPFPYLLTALAIGMTAGSRIDPPYLLAAGAALLTAAVSLVAIRLQRGATAVLLMTVSAAGLLLAHPDTAGRDPTSLKNLYEAGRIQADSPVELTGTLHRPPEPAPELFYIDIEAESVRIGPDILPAGGRARLMMPVGDRQVLSEFKELNLRKGTRVRVLVKLNRGESFRNPGSPDFTEFLERKGFDLKGTLRSPLLVEVTGRTEEGGVSDLIFEFRLRAMEAIDRCYQPPVSGTLKAMLMGNRYFLDPETGRRLREGATFHIVVIAGLHVGIIAWFLLGGRQAGKRRNPIRVVAVITVLWIYAIMVGLSPPVTRATAMITAGMAGPLFFRRSSSLNSVSLAAFIMLAFDPSLTGDPGFQLSFAAVFGITGLAHPLAEKLKRIGSWKPSAHTPQPPLCPQAVRVAAEILFWDERAFRAGMQREAVRYGLDKSDLARWVNRWRIQPVLRWGAMLTATSAAIQLTTLPFMAFYFNRAAPAGLVINIWAGLLTSGLMVTSAAAITVSAFSSSLGSHLTPITCAFHYLLANSMAPFAGVEWASFRVPHWDGPGIALYILFEAGLCGAGVFLMAWNPAGIVFPVSRERPRAAGSGKRARMVLGTLSLLVAAVSLLLILRPHPPPADGVLTVHFLDVGEGDSILVVFPAGKTMLIDGGGEIAFEREDRNQADEGPQRDSGFSIGEEVVCRFLWAQGRGRVDYVVMTHTDEDHLGGLRDVVKSFDVGEFISGAVPAGNASYEGMLSDLRSRSIPVANLKAGQSFIVDGVRLDALWPYEVSPLPGRAGGAPPESTNNGSLVLKMTYGRISILLTGDIEKAVESRLAGSGPEAVLLKLPHHGSATSSSEPFLKAVDPEYAVATASEHSRFHHPSPAVLRLCQSLGVRVYVTGRDGTVSARIDGRSLSLSTFNAR